VGGSTQTVDSGLEWAQSWNQIQTLKECFSVTNIVLTFGTLMHSSVIASRAVSNKESRYPGLYCYRFLVFGLLYRHTLRPLPFNHSKNRNLDLLKSSFGIPASI